MKTNLQIEKEMLDSEISRLIMAFHENHTDHHVIEVVLSYRGLTPGGEIFAGARTTIQIKERLEVRKK